MNVFAKCAVVLQMIRGHNNSLGYLVLQMSGVVLIQVCCSHLHADRDHLRSETRMYFKAEGFNLSRVCTIIT